MILKHNIPRPRRGISALVVTLVMFAIPLTAGAAVRANTLKTLAVVATSPTDTQRAVSGVAAIRIRFSAPIESSSPMPTIEPPVPGSWTVDGSLITFSPAGAFQPDSTVTVTIPDGTTGVVANSGDLLAASDAFSFSIKNGSVLRAEQLLAELNYLPVAWHRRAPIVRGLASYERAAFHAPYGSFGFLGQPPSVLRALWKPGVSSAILTSSLTEFERHEHLPIDGLLSARVWKDLLRIGYAPARFASLVGFTYALASKNLPESLTIWQGGRVAFHSLANTGIPQSPTADGTYAIYDRLANQVMTGTSPFGGTYSDPVSWVVYFHGSDAVHYIYRASYGFPQSFGCVELPWAPAERAWGLLLLGTLITVEN